MVRHTLQQISDLLERHNQGSNRLAIALGGDDAKLWEFLESNELWGGMGSIADRGLIDRDGRVADDRSELVRLMIKLGREQIRLGETNARTSSWVEVFEKWEAGAHRAPPE